MQIIVTDRASIEQGILVRSSYDVISIRDPERDRARVYRSAGLRRVLHLGFHDSDPADWRGIDVPDDIRLFTRRQAKLIWKFVEQSWQTVGSLVVYCHQGASRSPAVAAAIARKFEMDWQSYFEDFTPNSHVYQVMLETM